jgi:parallel beta-helix repeat protein
VQPGPTPGRPRRAARRAKRRRWPGFALLGALILAALAAAAVSLESLGVAPRLLALHLERRASGHNALIEGTAALASRWLLRADRGELLPRAAYPRWAGARAEANAPAAPPGRGRAVLVATAADALAAFERAEAGDTITLLPGTYRFSGHAVNLARPGRADAPITVRAERLGQVVLEFELLEGFHVGAPFWIFENLEIRGVCRSHDGCEHAFHVVGAAHHVEIRNNVVRDFHAHIKINGAGGRFPDGGRIAFNTLVNGAPRRTDAPVTPIDIVAASGWTIEGNLIADFVKDGGDRTSYGAFAKGGGSGNRFIGNVVLCEHRLRGARGRRIGLSFGGGGSDPRLCRDRRCIVEHDDGLIANNLIASCSDEGIYLNRAARTRLLHNTVLDTAGVVVRFPESAAHAAGNLIDGPLRARDGGALDALDNRTQWLAASFVGLHPVRGLFADADALDLRWAGTPPRRAGAVEPATDLCGAQRAALAAYGAFEDFRRCVERADAPQR